MQGVFRIVHNIFLDEIFSSRFNEVKVLIFKNISFLSFLIKHFFLDLLFSQREYLFRFCVRLKLFRMLWLRVYLVEKLLVFIFAYFKSKVFLFEWNKLRIKSLFVVEIFNDFIIFDEGYWFWFITDFIDRKLVFIIFIEALKDKFFICVVIFWRNLIVWWCSFSLLWTTWRDISLRASLFHIKLFKFLLNERGEFFLFLILLWCLKVIGMKYSFDFFFKERFFLLNRDIWSWFSWSYKC